MWLIGLSVWLEAATAPLDAATVTDAESEREAAKAWSAGALGRWGAGALGLDWIPHTLGTQISLSAKRVKDFLARRGKVNHGGRRGQQEVHGME